MRVLVTGAGGELGYRVTSLVEADPSVDAVAAVDLRAPARRFRRAELTVVDPRERRRLVTTVQRFAPTAIVHLGVYEPDARSSPALAEERTRTATLAVLGAAADLGGLDRIVVRSGLEVYGRGRRAVSVPDEDVAPDPRTPFGRSLVDVERVAVATGHSADVPVACLRLAPVQGPGVPSPLGRLLRLPAVPVDALVDPTFSLLHVEDAAAAVLAALRARHHGPLNVVGSGAVSVLQAVRVCGRFPVPVFGPGWPLARAVAAAAGAPLPDHHLELLRRGRTADGARARSVLDVHLRPTLEVVQGIGTWLETPTLRLVAGLGMNGAPDRHAGGAVGEVGQQVATAAGGMLSRRLRGEVAVDPWGLDPEVADLVRQAATLTARVKLAGPGFLPTEGPCVVVVNRRFGLAEPFVALRAVHDATGRRARFLGMAPGPLDTVWRRVGGAVDRPEELAGLLRAGQMVLVPLTPVPRSRRRAGALSPARLGPALDLGAPVIPLALVGNELTGRWTAWVGEEVSRPTGHSPLSQFDLAASAVAGVQSLLDDAFPPRWPFS